MKTNTDARYLINRKKLKTPSAINKKKFHGTLDARNILNSKLGNKSRFFNRNAAASVNQSSFSNFKRIIPSTSHPKAKAQDKHVKLARDGNIVITAKSKNTTNAPRPRWTPSNVDTTDVEHLGIDDVLDMDSLPSAPIGLNLYSHEDRSLAEEMTNMQNTMIADQISLPQQSVSVLVSNLHFSVSQQDIMELFGDVGSIKRAEMVHPGVALVEFFDANNAIRACDLYHNRLLDGQSMQCQIQQQSTQRTLISQRLGGRVAAAQPRSSISSRSVHNPRNVRFTVKLT